MSAFRLEREAFPATARGEFYFSTPALAARCDELCSAAERGHVLLTLIPGKQLDLGFERLPPPPVPPPELSS